MEQRGEKIEDLPAKAIATKKPPNRKKARVVVCGNFTEDRDGENVSVGDICAMAVRCLVHMAACNQWAIGSIDVTGTFLQAPRRSKLTTTIVTPPRLLQLLKITKPTEKWRVNCALYGFVESPGDWACHRDAGMAKMTWTRGGKKFRLIKTPEQHLWKVISQDEKSTAEEVAGWVAVYVDDFLVTMHPDDLPGAFEAIKATWKCSQEELVTEEKGMRFCGYEIQQTKNGGFHLKQESYIKDILAKYEVQGEERQPMPKIEDEDDEVNPDLNKIKEVQTLCGELQWISNKTRPDVSYSVGVMARLIHRRPTWVCQVGKSVLRYLNGTADLGLQYDAVDKATEEWKELQVLADTSYAPPHEKYRSVQGVIVEHGDNILAWESTRQAFITQSTAEAELVGYNEAYQMGEATASLLEVFNVQVERKLKGDCKAVLAQILGDTGPWRTRHLRLRSAKLREALKETDGQWTATHKARSRSGSGWPDQSPSRTSVHEVRAAFEDERRMWTGGRSSTGSGS